EDGIGARNLPPAYRSQRHDGHSGNPVEQSFRTNARHGLLPFCCRFVEVTAPLCFASLGIRGVPLHRNQMWDQCPTSPRWAAFHTEMCELLHTSLKFFTPLEGNRSASAGQQVLLHRGGSFQNPTD